MVVRASDGAELGTAVHEYPHAVIERTLPATGEQLPPAWALQDPDDYREVLRTAVRRGRGRGRGPGDASSASRTDFTASTPLPVAARRHAAVRARRSSAAARTRTRSCGSTTPRRRRPSASPRSRPSAASRGSPLRRADLLRVAVRQGAAGARGGPGDLRARWTAGSRRADWIVWQLCGEETRNVCTAGYKGIHQDGAYPSREYLRALDPRFAGFVADKLEHPLVAAGRPRRRR